MEYLQIYLAIILIVLLMGDIVYHIHHHYMGDDKEVNEKLHFIIKQNNQIMAKQERVDAALAKIDAATSGIAADIRELLEKERDNISEESIIKLENAADVLDQTGKLYNNSGEGGTEPPPPGTETGEQPSTL